MLQRAEWVFMNRTSTTSLDAFAGAFASTVAGTRQIRVVLGTPDWAQLFDDEPSLCKDKNPTQSITLADVRESYESDDFPSTAVLLRSGSHCIGFALFHVTHFSPSFELVDDSTYMYISYVCGSKYRGVGSAIIELLREYQRFVGASILYLDAIPWVLPFYEKLGFEAMEDQPLEGLVRLQSKR